MSAIRVLRPSLPRAVVLGVLLGTIALNGMAYMHVRAMTHFIERGNRTPPPEHLRTTDKLRTLLTGVAVPRPHNTRTPAAVGLPYETHPIRVDDRLTLEAWLIRHPEPRGAVLLFPGYASSKEQLLEAARVLHGLGQVVVLVDFRGSGGSGGDRTSVGYDEARDVAAAMRWARVDLRLDRPVLYGTSMGAAAVLRAVAVEGVQPRALVLEAPFDRLLTTVRHRFEAMRLPSFPGAELLLFWASVQSGFNAFQHNPVDYARRVHVPTLILHGHDDPRVTEAEARAIYDRLPAAKVIEVFPNVGHGVTGVIPPETWRDVVGRFLSALSPN